jgi:hypothetical protein
MGMVSLVFCVGADDTTEEMAMIALGPDTPDATADEWA